MSRHAINIVMNREEEATSLDIGSLCSPQSITDKNPIDDYYSHIGEHVQLSNNEYLINNAVSLRLLMLGLVSVTEFYFRSVLAGVINICPYSWEKASSSQIALGSIDYYEKNDLGFALMEHKSLSSCKEIKKETKNITDIDIAKNSSVDSALLEFDKICQLRHATVHSRGELNSKNSRDLNIKFETMQCLSLSTIQFQGLVIVCHSVVRAYNRFLFEELLQRWINQQLFEGNWSADKDKFIPLYKHFYSKHDSRGVKNAYHAYLKIRTIIRKSIK